MRRRDVGGLAGVLCAVSIAASAAVTAQDPTPVEGVWVRHERNFVYMGVTSHYSCDGLEGKLKYLLRLAGAREDLSVRSFCSEPHGGPSRMASARLAYYTLVPADSPQASAVPDGKSSGQAAKPLKVEPPTPGVGQWKTVELSGSRNRELQPGDCEVVEQFDRELLADFATRNHTSRFSCIPHQESLNGIQSHFEVLAPLPKAPVSKTAPVAPVPPPRAG